jgi:hypothetical protein
MTRELPPYPPSSGDRFGRLGELPPLDPEVNNLESKLNRWKSEGKLELAAKLGLGAVIGLAVLWWYQGAGGWPALVGGAAGFATSLLLFQGAARLSWPYDDHAFDTARLRWCLRWLGIALFGAAFLLVMAFLFGRVWAAFVISTVLMLAGYLAVSRPQERDRGRVPDPRPRSGAGWLDRRVARGESLGGQTPGACMARRPSSTSGPWR